MTEGLMRHRHQERMNAQNNVNKLNEMNYNHDFSLILNVN